ncbi:hypothetical protein I4U23_007747 [Adineta vaga]|nr:hypothetical protein I4U23_007747 [Adineta vaga]
MDYSRIGLNDLPDELLLIILKNLPNFDIYYSLQGVNQRLNQIIRDSIFTHRLRLVKRSEDRFINLLSDSATHN